MKKLLVLLEKEFRQVFRNPIARVESGSGGRRLHKRVAPGLGGRRKDIAPSSQQRRCGHKRTEKRSDELFGGTRVGCVHVVFRYEFDGWFRLVGPVRIHELN